MHIIPLVIYTILMAIGTIGCVFYYYDDIQEYAGLKFKLKMWLVRAGAFFIQFGLGLSWWIYSVNQPYPVDISSTHEIKDVTYPDGTSVQMFSCEGKHINVTALFNKIVDKEWQVRRVRYSSVCAGVSWSIEPKYDSYYLENKSKDKAFELPSSSEE